MSWFTNFISWFSLTNQLYTEHLNDTYNRRPVIGVLSQELTPKMKSFYHKYNYSSYISASYVKFIEAGGARVVPILINQDEDYYVKTFTSINGALFPGGHTWVDGTGMGKAGKKIWEMAQAANDAGDYFPIWGTCLGFELLMYLETEPDDNRQKCSSVNEALKLELTADSGKSRLVGTASELLLNILTRERVTFNSHTFCYSEQDFRTSKLDKTYDIVSFSVGHEGLHFVSAVESKTYPFYGIQFHPEKNLFEWDPVETNIPHSLEATMVAQYFSRFFVEEARRNKHRFISEKALWKKLIYNYPIKFTLLDGFSFDQCYFFA